MVKYSEYNKAMSWTATVVVAVVAVIAHVNVSKMFSFASNCEQL